ncbi:MAG: hypothetical protein QGH93_07995 [Gammaproteobacteria bacterium]|nr:hypothetical protein [Chromatiales bacterium]MDP6674769.1 hypothetical protein [Gammaproteobacteria bacterium]
MLLLASIVALILGPALFQFSRVGPRPFKILEGFSFITITGLLCFGIMPQAIGAGGIFAWVFAALGLIFPVGLERLFHGLEKQVHLLILSLGVVGLAVHAGIDGIALAAGPLVGVDAETWWHMGHREGGEYLALAVILHRFPLGLAVWYLLSPALGRMVAVMVLMVLAGATVIGYLVGPNFVSALQGSGIAWFQAFVAGSILHVVIYEPGHHKHAHEHQGVALEKWPDRIGIILGLVALYVYF